VDDMKLIGRSEEDSRKEIRVLKIINNDIKMDNGFEKCGRFSSKRS
jgi:hypothetical protein